MEGVFRNEKPWKRVFSKPACIISNLIVQWFGFKFSDEPVTVKTSKLKTVARRVLSQIAKRNSVKVRGIGMRCGREAKRRLLALTANTESKRSHLSLVAGMSKSLLSNWQFQIASFNLFQVFNVAICSGLQVIVCRTATRRLCLAATCKLRNVNPPKR